MGEMTDAKCSACDYSARVTIGGTRASYTKHSTWPVYCAACNTLTHTNVFAELLVCSSCGSVEVTKYDETHLATLTVKKILRRVFGPRYLRHTSSRSQGPRLSSIPGGSRPARRTSLVLPLARRDYS